MAAAPTILSVTEAKALIRHAALGDGLSIRRLFTHLMEGDIFRTYAGSPVGNVVPVRRGEWLFDSTNSLWYRSTALTNADWTAMSLTAAEFAFLTGANAANNLASKAALLDASKQLQTGANLGTPGVGVTAVEVGDGRTHTSILTVASTLPAIAGGASLGVGKLLYTLPAGAQFIEASRMSLGITQTQGNINANAPKVGLGTVIASGVVSVLNGTATFMNIITEQTAANCTGTATVKAALPTAGNDFVTEEAGAKTIYFNAAAAWSAGGDAAALLAGTVALHWKHLS